MVSAYQKLVVEALTLARTTTDEISRQELFSIAEHWSEQSRRVEQHGFTAQLHFPGIRKSRRNRCSAEPEPAAPSSTGLDANAPLRLNEPQDPVAQQDRAADS
jgi:hypothetical protein